LFPENLKSVEGRGGGGAFYLGKYDRSPGKLFTSVQKKSQLLKNMQSKIFFYFSFNTKD